MSSELDTLVTADWWEWRPGMQSINAGGIRGLVTKVFVETGWLEVTYHLKPGDCGSSDGHHRSWYDPVHGGIRPDLDHGGTQGEMVHLVRKAWAAARIEVVVFDDGRAGVRIARDDATTIEFVDVSLGLALAAGLLAAPPRTMGRA